MPTEKQVPLRDLRREGARWSDVTPSSTVELPGHRVDDAERRSTMCRRPIIPLSALLLSALTAPSIAAPPTPTTGPASVKEVTVKVLAPWQGKGEVFQVGPDTLLLLGTFEGIMYIERGEGSLDAAIFTCPSTTRIRQFADTLDSKGWCTMTSEEGDLAFAEFECAGPRDACRGEFRVTGGTGALTGITGEGEVVVRTALRGMAEDAQSGSLISNAEGLAVWPALTLRIPMEPPEMPTNRPGDEAAEVGD
jgi:hypothetical protein